MVTGHLSEQIILPWLPINKKQLSSANRSLLRRNLLSTCYL